MARVTEPYDLTIADIPQNRQSADFNAQAQAFLNKWPGLALWMWNVVQDCFDNATTSLSLEAIRSDMENVLASRFAAKASLSGAAFTGPVSFSGPTDFTGGSIVVPWGSEPNEPVTAGQFDSYLDYSGWQRLPSGLILQWDYISGGGYHEQSFPTVFPERVFAVAFANTFVDTTQVLLDDVNTTNEVIAYRGYNTEVNSNSSTGAAFYIAIGI